MCKPETDDVSIRKNLNVLMYAETEAKIQDITGGGGDGSKILSSEENLQILSIQVNDVNSVLVEVYVISGPRTGSAEWFEDRHLQEVLQLVRGVLTDRVAELQCKRLTTAKTNLPTDSIIAGHTVRVGYLFKKRPGNQNCLVPSTYLNQAACNEDSELSSLYVLKEKLLIYVCQNIPGSPHSSITQLMKVLGDTRAGPSQTPSISNYFHKVTSPPDPGSQSVTTGAGAGTSGIIPAHPPSEGRRHALKNILGRRETKRKHRMLTKSNKGRLSDLSKFLTKHSDTNNSTETSVNTNKTEHCDDAVSLIGHKPNLHGLDTEPNIIETTEAESKKWNQSCGNINDGISIGGVTIKRIDGPLLSLPGSDSESAGTVTVISVEQMHDIQKMQVSQNVLSPSSTSPLVTTGGSVLSKIASYSMSPQCTRASVSPRCTSASVSPKCTSDSVTPVINSNILIDGIKSHGISSDVSEPHSDSSCEMLCLPSASFVIKPTVKEENSIDQLCDKSSVLEDKLQHSPIFSKQKRDINLQETISGKHESTSVPIDRDSDSENDSAARKGKNTTKQSRPRFKRQLPNFSDSDSEEIVPHKVKSKSRKVEPKFVKENEMKGAGKKFNISKSFFSDGKEKAQPTLAFFMGNKDNQKQMNRQAHANGKDADEDVENIDCYLMEELSNYPKVKEEMDADIKREIQSFHDVSELNEKHLGYLVRHSEKHLRDIFQGKIECERHNMYKQGGKNKRNLTYDSGVGQYSEEQVDVVMEGLMAIFCKHHHKYLDYIMKVLLPEMLTKFHKEIHGAEKQSPGE